MKRDPLSKANSGLRFNLFDFFIAGLFLVGVLAAYFTFVKPAQFSHLILREAEFKYAEVEMILPDDLAWIETTVRPGQEFRNIYGQLDWQIVSVGREDFSGKSWVKVTAKVLSAEKDSGIIRYGKYTLVPGGKIYLVNNYLALEGRILRCRVLNEKVLS